MKTKISIDLPTAAQLTAGLTPAECHPALARAERDVTDAERVLVERRQELANQERVVAALPARIQSGQARAGDLETALRSRDGAAMMIAGAEVALEKARQQLPLVQRAATVAVQRELDRRVEILEKAAAEITPALEAINELARAIAAKLGPSCVITSIDWPESPADMASRARLAMGVPAVPAFGNSKGNTP